MAAPRLVVEVSIGEEDVPKLMAMRRSRTEPASRVERARMLLAYRANPSFFAVGRLLGEHHQTVQRCVERAAAVAPGLDPGVWTTRLLASHAREHGPAAVHACLAGLVQGTVCMILDAREVKPHKMRYYLERRDPEFAEKMAQILCVYKEVEILKEAAAASKEATGAGAIVSYDEKPGVQATTAPDLQPIPGVHAAARDHEYKRHGTLSPGSTW